MISRLPDEHFNFFLESCFDMKQGYCIDQKEKIIHAFSEAKITSTRKDLRLDIRKLLVNPEQVNEHRYEPMKEVLESAWKTRNTTWTALLNFLSPSVENILEAISKYSIKVDEMTFFAGNRSKLIVLKDLMKVNNFLLEAQKMEVWQLDSKADPECNFRSNEEYLKEEQPYLSDFIKVAENVLSPEMKNTVMLEFSKHQASLELSQSTIPGTDEPRIEDTETKAHPLAQPTYNKKLSVAHLVYKLSPNTPFTEIRPLVFLDRLTDWMLPLCGFVEQLEVDVLVALCRIEVQEQIQEAVDVRNMSFIGTKASAKKKKPVDSDDEEEDNWQGQAQAEPSNEQVLVTPLYGVTCSKDKTSGLQLCISKFLNMLFTNINIKSYAETILEAFSVYGREYANSFEQIDYRFNLEIIQLATSFTLLGQSLYFEDWRNKSLKDQMQFEKSGSDIFSSQARLHENVIDIVYVPNKRIELKNVLVRQTDPSKSFDLVNCAINNFLEVFQSNHFAQEESQEQERTITCKNAYLEIYNKPSVNSSNDYSPHLIDIEDDTFADSEWQSKGEGTLEKKIEECASSRRPIGVWTW